MHAGLSTELQASKADQRGFQVSVQQALAAMGASLSDPKAPNRPGTLLAQPPERAAASGANIVSASRPASGGQELLCGLGAALEPLAQLQAMRSPLSVLASATHAMALRSRPQTAAAPALARASLHSARGSMGRRGSNIVGFFQQEALAPATQQAEPAAVPADALDGPAASALQELRAALSAGSIGHKLDSSSAVLLGTLLYATSFSLGCPRDFNLNIQTNRKLSQRGNSYACHLPCVHLSAPFCVTRSPH